MCVGIFAYIYTFTHMCVCIYYTHTHTYILNKGMALFCCKVSGTLILCSQKSSVAILRERSEPKEH